MKPDLLIPDLLPEDERLWAPLDDGVFTRPLSFDVTHGGYVHVLRVTRSGMVARHRHTGTVHAVVLKGAWYYLEHEWTAEEGSFVLEPPGETHTLMIPEGCNEMMTVFAVNGALIYLDADGATTGYDDVFTRLEKTRVHYEKVGLGSELEKLIR
jgi:hypothetical protein